MKIDEPLADIARLVESRPELEARLPRSVRERIG